MEKTTRKSEFEITIKPADSWTDFDILDSFKYRDLLYLLVKRDFTVQYAQSILGPLWYFITPLISTFVFVIVFGKITQVPTDGLPHTLFYLSGLTLWNFFGGCVGKTQDILFLNTGIFGKVYFPRIIVPISYVISSVIPHMAQIFALACTIAWFVVFQDFHFVLTWKILLLPFLVLLSGALALGIGLIASCLSYRFRDFVGVMGFFLSMLMYASPIVYPASRIPENWKTVFFLNPMAPLIEAYRNSIFGTGNFPWAQMPQVILSTVVILGVGYTLFHRVQKTYVDTV